jgi:hypothetical protein
VSLILRSSLQGRFSLIHSTDSALQPRPEDEAAQVEYDQALKVARETGKWDALLKPGDAPTIFHCELPTDRRKLHDLFTVAAQAGHLSSAMALVFRAAVKSIDNLPLKLAWVAEHGLDLLDVDIIAQLDAISPSIVNELGGVIWQRMVAIPGKS